MAEDIDKVESIEMREQVMELTNPWIEAGKELGLEQGRQEGRRAGRQEGEAELVLRQLKRRFASLPQSEEKAVRNLPLEKIEALGEALLDFSSLSDAVNWLRTNS